MHLLVGLGNPGKKYRNNRHNIGYMAIDNIIETTSGSVEKEKFNSLNYDAKIDNQRILMAKPQTYVNNSGEAIIKLINYHKIPNDKVLVIHDDLDLNFGNIKIKNGGGTAGHNGLKSIVSHIGNDFTRIRIGIGHPGSKELVSNYVLSNFSSAEMAYLPSIFDYIAYNIVSILSEKEKFTANIPINDAEIPYKSNPIKKLINLFKS